MLMGHIVRVCNNVWSANAESRIMLAACQSVCISQLWHVQTCTLYNIFVNANHSLYYNKLIASHPMSHATWHPMWTHSPPHSLTISNLVLDLPFWWPVSTSVCKIYQKQHPTPATWSHHMSYRSAYPSPLNPTPLMNSDILLPLVAASPLLQPHFRLYIIYFIFDWYMYALAHLHAFIFYVFLLHPHTALFSMPIATASICMICACTIVFVLLVKYFACLIYSYYFHHFIY